MTLDLPGRTVVITGASGGLGAGLASALRAHGANVALLDLDADAVRQQADRLGGDRFARGWSIDPRDLEGLQQAMGQVAEHFGAIDVVVAGAGVLGTLENRPPMESENFPRVCPVGHEASRPKTSKGTLCGPFRQVSDGTRTRGRRDHNPEPLDLRPPGSGPGATRCRSFWPARRSRRITR